MRKPPTPILDALRDGLRTLEAMPQAAIAERSQLIEQLRRHIAEIEALRDQSAAVSQETRSNDSRNKNNQGRASAQP